MPLARARTAALALSALLGLIYVLFPPQTLDLSAQTFRADLWDAHGFVIWSPDWYSGFSVPGYSLVYPPLGALLGPVLLGALSAVAATALFSSIAARAFGERAWLGIIWFGLASMAAPFAGRTTFALGLAVGLACIWAVQRRRGVLAAVAGALTALTSPVAGLFALLACAAVLPAAWRLRGADGEEAGEGLPWRSALAGAVGAGLALALLGLAFPTPGWQPFAFSAWIWVPVVVVALVAATAVRRGEEADRAFEVLRWAALLYLLVATAALVVHTPLGGNAARLGATLAGPLLAIVLVPPAGERRGPWPRPLVLALVAAVPLLWWQWTATVRDVVSAAGDPATERAYFEPLLAALDEEADGLEPLRVLPTRNRWESVYVAEQQPITGGWLRQLESPDFDFLEVDEIDPDQYRLYLARRGVGLVAVSDAEPDRLGIAEKRLFDSGVFDDFRVAEAGDWTLYRFGDPGSWVAEGNAELRALANDSFELELGDRANALLQLSYSPYFEVMEGEACVERERRSSDHDLTRVRSTLPLGSAPQTVRVEAHLSPAGALGRDSDCND